MVLLIIMYFAVQSQGSRAFIARQTALAERTAPMPTLIDSDPHAPMLTDDRRVNEYYFLRRRFRKTGR
jgi:hypothetical protein